MVWIDSGTNSASDRALYKTTATCMPSFHNGAKLWNSMLYLGNVISNWHYYLLRDTIMGYPENRPLTEVTWIDSEYRGFIRQQLCLPL